MSIKKGIIGFAVSIVARGGASQKAVVEIDPAGPGEKSALTHFIGGQVSGVEVIERAGEKGQLEHFRDALEHIRKTCYQSRTQTRRLRWIIKRVDLVLAGRPYVAAEHSVPVDGISEYHKQKRLAGRYLEERNNYLSIINATLAVFEDDADVVGYIEALLTSTTAASSTSETERQLQCRLEVSEDTLKTIRQCLASAEKELDQCAAMAAMVQSREWADMFCTAPVPSAVESAFTQLHNELGAANARIAELENQLGAIQALTGVYIPRGQSVELAGGSLVVRRAGDNGAITEFKIPDLRGIYLRASSPSGFKCSKCGEFIFEAGGGLVVRETCKCPRK